jgi:hypothetical protein
MPGTEHSTASLKDFCSFGERKRQRNKESISQESSVILWTTGGRIEVDVVHSIVAAPDAVIDMARRDADVSPQQFNRGEIA